MKQFSKIMSFLLLLFVLTAEDCSDGGNRSSEISKEDRMTDLFKNIEDEFINDELTQEILSAFEERAIQKLNDLADYLNIYADTSLSKEFRLQAKQMLLESFNSAMDLQAYFKNINLSEDSLNAIIYYSENEGSFDTQINSIVIKENLQKRISSSYVGELSFSQKVYSSTFSKKVNSNSFILNGKMHVIKTEKEFGNETQDVWEVSIGEIR
jgi:hypothetical protein